jgi:hypothetical protein
MYTNQNLKNFNVTHRLLESIFFDRNKPTCDACRFLRENLFKIFLKILFSLTEKKSWRWLHSAGLGWFGHPMGTPKPPYFSQFFF